MKILYDHSVFQNQRYGGISRYFYEIITRIAPQHDVDLFQGIHINEYNLTEVNFNKYCGINPHLPLSPFIRSHLFIAPNKVLFDRFYKKSKPDIYHPTYYYQSINKHHKAPIVLTVYDLIHERFPNQLRYSNYTIQAKKASIEAADHLICISNSTKRDLIEFYDVPEHKITVVYLASSLKPVNKHVDITKKYGISKPYLLYVGDRNDVYKNFLTLLNAFVSSLKDQYDLVCFGGGSFNKEELEIITRARCEGKITQMSGPDSLLSSLYSNAHAFICSSLYEGFGLPLLEAMSLKCPVIAADTSSIPEVVGSAAILFDPHQKSDLIEAVEKVNDKRDSLIEAGTAQERKFSWDKCASETLEVYKDLLE